MPRHFKKKSHTRLVPNDAIKEAAKLVIKKKETREANMEKQI